MSQVRQPAQLLNEKSNDSGATQSKGGRQIEISERSPALRLRRSVRRAPVHIAVGLFIVIWGLPLLGYVITAFRSTAAAANTGWWQAFSHPAWTLDQFRTAFRAGLGHAAINSFLITIPANIALVTVGAVVAYVLTQLTFIGRTGVLVAALGFLVVPPQISLEPTFKLFAFLHLIGKIPAVWIFQAGFTLPLGIFILVAFFSQIPAELVEAARMDGASEVKVFTRVIVPLGYPGLISVLILHFIFSWNDLLVPLLFLNSSAAPLTVQVAGIAQQTNADTEAALAAASLLSVIPPVVLFYSLQKYFVRGLTGGALKG